MKEFKEVVVDVLGTKHNHVMYDKESVVKAIEKLEGKVMQLEQEYYGTELPFVGHAKNFKVKDNTIVADIVIEEGALPTSIGLGYLGDMSVGSRELEQKQHIEPLTFFTREVTTVSTVNKHIDKGVTRLK